jgi:hypothetical protein
MFIGRELAENFKTFGFYRHNPNVMLYLSPQGRQASISLSICPTIWLRKSASILFSDIKEVFLEALIG